MSLYEPIFDELNQGRVRYVVVGGLAVVLHGFARLTADVDIIVDLSPAEARKAVDALSRLGMRPRAPVDPAGFADPAIRESWIAEKGLAVFSFQDDANPLRSVDLFVRHPLPFEDLWARSVLVSLGRIHVRVAAIEDLIALKRKWGRPVDLTDIDALERIRRLKGHAG